jgi:adenylosuccinate synthase
MGLLDLLKDVKTVGIICLQYGDSGKGKFSDLIAAQWADVIARGTGGNNAGHTVYLNGQEFAFHLIPAGITYDKEGKINILGNGMVINPQSLCWELDVLDRMGITYNHLLVSKDAHALLPFQVELDMAKNKSQEKGGIGSTGRGIGPCYTDKVARRGITIEDLLDKDALAIKLQRIINTKAYPEGAINIEQIVGCVMPYAERIRPFVADTVSLMHQYMREHRRICLEGAQGLLLSIEHGTYPFVTSSDCSINGTTSGVGLSAGAIDLTLGLVKFPFMTRVGGGPFPTEFGGHQSEIYCGKDEGNKMADELAKHEIPSTQVDGKIKYDLNHPKIIEMMNSSDPFIQGIGIRLAAKEYGASTGRPRRTGWTDGVAARYAVGINAPLKLVLTKPDSVAGLKEFQVAYEYKDNGAQTSEFRKDEAFLRRVVPEYLKYDGYSSIEGETNYESLPRELKQAIGHFESFVGAPAAVISTGPEQSQTIVRT